jgi:hypothetical protein
MARRRHPASRGPRAKQTRDMPPRNPHASGCGRQASLLAGGAGGGLRGRRGACGGVWWGAGAGGGACMAQYGLSHQRLCIGARTGRRRTHATHHKLLRGAGMCGTAGGDSGGGGGGDDDDTRMRMHTHTHVPSPHMHAARPAHAGSTWRQGRRSPTCSGLKQQVVCRSPDAPHTVRHLRCGQALHGMTPPRAAHAVGGRRPHQTPWRGPRTASTQQRPHADLGHHHTDTMAPSIRGTYTPPALG